MKKYLIFDLDGTIISSKTEIKKHILTFIKEKEPKLYDKARYLIETTQGMALKNFLYEIVGDNIKAEKYSKDIYNILGIFRNSTDFFPGVPEKIKKLSKKYKLFLTTGSSTIFAKTILKDGNIKNCFELIYGSDEILK